MDDKTWDEFKAEYAPKLKLTFDTMDFVADSPILKHYLHGLSNEDIANELGYHILDVQQTIMRWFGEMGRSWTLMYDPLEIYYDAKDMDEFKYLLHTTDEETARLYAYCTLYRLSKEQTKEEYDGQ
jgi:hypothetical protein